MFKWGIDQQHLIKCSYYSISLMFVGNFFPSENMNFHGYLLKLAIQSFSASVVMTTGGWPKSELQIGTIQLYFASISVSAAYFTTRVQCSVNIFTLHNFW